MIKSIFVISFPGEIKKYFTTTSIGKLKALQGSFKRLHLELSWISTLKISNRGLSGEKLSHIWPSVEHSRIYGRDSAGSEEALYKAGTRKRDYKHTCMCCFKNGSIKEDPIKPDGNAKNSKNI